MRHARHDEDIAVADARRARHPVGDQFGPIGHARHPQPRFIHAAACFVIPRKRGAGFGMDDHPDAKRNRHCVNRDIVMRRANAAGGEQIIVACAQGIHGLDNRILYIGHHANLCQPYALDIQPKGDLRNILVLRPAGQDFIADHDKGGGPDAGGGHGPAIATKPGTRKGGSLLLYSPP